MEGVPAEIIRHYEVIDEGQRITEGLGRLELLRTREVVRRQLAGKTGTVIDVGGATGVHASWLADDGHDVHVVDVVPRHVAEAAKASGRGGRITAEIGDARQLPVDDATFDVGLLFGPLYHLTDRHDRLRAWSEVQRVVRPGGLIFAAAVSRHASLFDGLARGYLFDPDFRRIVEGDLRDGQHRNPTDVPHWFTTAYFHHPDDLRREAEDAGLEVVELVGLEGLAGWLPDLADRWDSDEGQETIMFAAQAVESEPSLLGLSGHLLAVTRRPG
jgi:SAM-dependent methyltransferase